MNVLNTATSSLLLASALVAATTVNAAEQELHLYTWAGIFDSKVLGDFTEQTGYQVREDNYDSDEMLETKLLAGAKGYDIAIPTAVPFLQREIKVGAMQKYDPKQVPNMSKVDPDVLKLLQVADPTLEYASIAAWGTTGMGLNKAMISQQMDNAPLNSWDLFFKPEYASKLSQCGFYMVDSATDVVPVVANYLGLDPTNLDKQTVDTVMETLYKIRPYVFLDAGKYGSELANGAICAALGWSGDVIRAQMNADRVNNGVQLDYVIPQEGSMAWLTTIAIPKGTANPQAANAFMNYMLEPEVAAYMSKQTGFPTPVMGARELLPDEMANSDILYPPAEVMAKLFSGSAQTDRNSRYLNRKWAQFRSAE
ncbi:extracellular solute-binding protein [Oceanobacter kriegii]|uniref:extracellular solute-binding protein n=1 Tax=Oceanobacter kriegii TaxID=64972 RepID=UPI000417F6E3|nr:extracellular solute-binding protein [Oceanobacter kriegii]